MDSGSILTSVKKMLGIAPEYTHFDADIIMHINSVFSILTQLGVGAPGGFAITGAEDQWSSFIGDDSRIEMIKSYMYHKVRLLFDPPTNSAVIEAMSRSISEFEFRINVAVDPKGQDGTDDGKLDIATDEEVEEVLDEVFGKQKV